MFSSSKNKSNAENASDGGILTHGIGALTLNRSSGMSSAGGMSTATLLMIVGGAVAVLLVGFWLIRK